jgi:hypothetical protein
VSASATAALLRSEDQAYLNEHFAWEATVEAAMVCVTMTDFPLAVGLSPTATELLIRLPPGFPDASPDMFWLASPVTRTDGQPIPATDVTESHVGRTWQRWSRHIGAAWRPGVDDLRSYIAYITTCLRRAAA